MAKVQLWVAYLGSDIWVNAGGGTECVSQGRWGKVLRPIGSLNRVLSKCFWLLLITLDGKFG